MKKKFKIEIIYNTKKSSWTIIHCKYLGITTQGNNFKELFRGFREVFWLNNEFYKEYVDSDPKMKKRYKKLNKLNT